MYDIRQFCRQRELPVPSRATVYNVIERLEAPVYSKSALPEAVRGTLYNLADEALVPGQQVVFYAFNYGDTPALCYLLENDKSCTVVQSPRP